MASKSLAQLVLYAMGGGWGDEQPGAGKVGVAVIRGTDIPKLRVGDHSSVPFRYESESKVRSRLLQVGDIVIEVSGGSAASGQHTGRALLVTTEVLQSLGGKVIPASFCRLLRLDAQQVHPGFVVRQIDSLHQSGEIAEFENQSTGIANFQFNRFVEETYPRIKDLDAQATIAEYISSFDRLNSFNRRTNQTLEAMAQAIFKSWFVDFDPVKAKIAAIKQGEDPLRAAMRAISGKTGTELDQMPREHHDQLAATAALFPDEMEESELGEIPMGWSAASFGSLLSHTIGGDWGAEVPDTLNDTRVAIIRGTDIPDLDLAQSNRVPVRYTSQKKLATRRLQVGDIVLEVSGGSKGQPTGRSFHMTANALREFDCPVEPASFCRLLRPISLEVGVLLGLHLSCIYQQGKTWEYQNQSTGIANFQTSHFLAAELVVTPTKLVIDRFYEIVGPILERRHDAQSKKLVELRDSLLPRLISGDLLVTAAEANHVKGSGL